MDYATNRGIPNEVPSLIWKCVHEVETRGMDTEGIYRVPGRHATVQEVMLFTLRSPMVLMVANISSRL